VTRRRLAVALGALVGASVALVASGCGTDDTGGAINAGPTSSAAPVEVALVVSVTAGGAGPDRHGSISCQGTNAIGTGHLLDPTAAAAACALVQPGSAAEKRLTEGAKPGQICTQQYGGPQQAKITGTLRGRTIDTTVDRKDGCGIADWDLLRALVGPAD
jgi:hypothetical protein